MRKSVRATCSKTSGLRPGVVRKVDDNGCRGAAHDDPSKRFQLRRIDFHVRQEGGDMNEIAGLCARDRLSSVAPAYFADAGEDIGDRFLFSVMMNARPRSRCYLEQATPDGRRDAERWCNSGATFGARRLRRALIEFSRADDVDCSG